jgi:8-hydroxy-5-deazaflavin:NADPH oxidoreductase
MTTPPTYSIVGSGNVGSALARIFARAHVDVTIANTRGPESLRELTSELGPTVQAASITDAIEHDVIFIPIPFHAVEALGQTLPDCTGKMALLLDPWVMRRPVGLGVVGSGRRGRGGTGR